MSVLNLILKEFSGYSNLLFNYQCSVRLPHQRVSCNRISRTLLFVNNYFKFIFYHNLYSWRQKLILSYSIFTVNSIITDFEINYEPFMIMSLYTTQENVPSVV